MNLPYALVAHNRGNIISSSLRGKNDTGTSGIKLDSMGKDDD